MATGFINPNELATGVGAPSGFTTRWGDGVAVVDNVNSLYGKTIRVNGGNPNLFSLDALDGAADVEVVMAFRMATVNINSRAGVWARVPTGTTSTSHSGYLGNLFRSVEPNSYIQIAETAAGAYAATHAETLNGWSENVLYWSRFRVSGSTLQLRFWEDGTAEPGTWTLSGTDTSYTVGGWSGLGHLGAGSSATMTVEALGWATAGDTAPASGDGSQIARPTGFTFTSAAAARQLDGAWTAVAEASTYDWEVEEDVNDTWVAFASGNTAATSFQLTDSDGVDWARTYRGRVRAVPA